MSLVTLTNPACILFRVCPPGEVLRPELQTRLWEFSQKWWQAYMCPNTGIWVYGIALFALIPVFTLLSIQVHILVFTLRLLYTPLTLYTLGKHRLTLRSCIANKQVPIFSPNSYTYFQHFNNPSKVGTRRHLKKLFCPTSSFKEPKFLSNSSPFL